MMNPLASSSSAAMDDEMIANHGDEQEAAFDDDCMPIHQIQKQVEGPVSLPRVGDPTTSGDQASMPSHFGNTASISAIERYGIVVAIVLTIALLLASDIGSGIAVLRELIPQDDVLFETQTDVVLEASVFSSVKSLWETGSYALVVLVVVTSIVWPYVKLLVTLVCWITPLTTVAIRQRLERLLLWIDALGKWSFVDIVVFLEIAVIFDSSIDLGGPVVQVYVVPQYGIFGFVAATCLSLVWTQLVLRRHRFIMYRRDPDHVVVDDDEDNDVEEVANIDDDNHATATAEAPREIGRPASITTLSVIGISILLLASTAMYVSGIIVNVYQVSTSQGTAQSGLSAMDFYSIVKLGMQLPMSSGDGMQGRMTWLALVWFALGVVAPLVCMLLCGVLLVHVAAITFSAAVGKSQRQQHMLERLLVWTEYAFGWSSAEVFAISTIFAISQVPKFGNGLNTSGCASCFVVDAQLLPTLGVLLAASLTYIVAALWLFRIVHPMVYEGRLKH